VARSVCGRGSHCLVNSCCCCTSASLPVRARHEWPGPVAAAAAAAAAARSSQTQREVRGPLRAGGPRGLGPRGRGTGGTAGPRAAGPGDRDGVAGPGGGGRANCQSGPVPAGTRPPGAHCARRPASAAPRGPAWPGAVSPRPTRPTLGLLTHSRCSARPDLAKLERTPGGLGDRGGGSRPSPGRPRAIVAPVSLRPVRRWAPSLCRQRGRPGPRPPDSGVPSLFAAPAWSVFLFCFLPLQGPFAGWGGGFAMSDDDSRASTSSSSSSSSNQQTEKEGSTPKKKESKVSMSKNSKLLSTSAKRYPTPFSTGIRASQWPRAACQGGRLQRRSREFSGRKMGHGSPTCFLYCSLLLVLLVPSSICRSCGWPRPFLVEVSRILITFMSDSQCDFRVFILVITNL
jgi:hypothetical protein